MSRYMRCTKIASRPAPLYYAHLAASHSPWYEKDGFREVSDTWEHGSTSSGKHSHIVSKWYHHLVLILGRTIFVWEHRSPLPRVHVLTVALLTIAIQVAAADRKSPSPITNRCTRSKRLVSTTAEAASGEKVLY